MGWLGQSVFCWKTKPSSQDTVLCKRLNDRTSKARTPLLKTTVLCYRSNENSSDSSWSSQDYYSLQEIKKENQRFFYCAMALRKQLKDKMKEVLIALGVSVQDSLLLLGHFDTFTEWTIIHVRMNAWTFRWLYVHSCVFVWKWLEVVCKHTSGHTPCTWQCKNNYAWRSYDRSYATKHLTTTLISIVNLLSVSHSWYSQPSPSVSVTVDDIW